MLMAASKILSLLLVLLLASAINPQHELEADILVRPLEDVPVNQTFVVAQDGTGNFTSIMHAVRSAPTNGQGYCMIIIREGVYREIVEIEKGKDGLILVGAGINKTIITGNLSVGGGSTTHNSATFAVNSDRFIAYDVTFENTAGPGKGQAVAVRTSGYRSIFYRCSFLGYQDTLYVEHYYQFYRDCDIYGTIDFIFGDAITVLQNCRILVRKPLDGQENVITAQGQNKLSDKSGISIHNCTIVAAPDLDPKSTKTFLGRPWGAVSRTVIMQSFIGDLIDPEGWLEWIGANDSRLNTLYYGEYDNRGPGSSTEGRVNWTGLHRNMSQSEASNFTVYSLIGESWLKSTTVPFFPGLL